jgi:uncharacterized protein YaaQ
MQILFAVVQAEDADLLIERLVAQGIRVTRINSVGSFLVRGNATILVGIEEAQVDQVLGIIRATCKTRKAYVNALPMGADAPHLSLAVPMPLEVRVGGATVFSLPVKALYRLQGGSRPAAADATFVAGSRPQEGGGSTNLMVAILHSDDADPVISALLGHGYRLTRLNTAGGFLRRGNVTLLIGVEGQQQVDDVLRITQANCRLRSEARPMNAGMPMYSATVFVLEADQFVRI